MTIQSNIEAVERLLSRKQMVPSKMIHDLMTDCKALLALTRVQHNQIEQLKAQPDAQAERAQEAK